MSGSGRSTLGASSEHLRLFDPSDADQREAHCLIRDEASYAQYMRRVVEDPTALSDVDAPLVPDNCPEYDNLYLRASNLSAKAYFDPSGITTAEQIELVELRRELRDVYGVDVA